MSLRIWNKALFCELEWSNNKNVLEGIMIIIVVHQKRESEKIIYMQLSKLTLVFLL